MPVSAREMRLFSWKNTVFRSSEVMSCLRGGLKVHARISHSSIRLSAQFAAAIVVGKRHGPVQRYRNQSRRCTGSKHFLEHLRPETDEYE